jgi:hypothetical protein
VDSAANLVASGAGCEHWAIDAEMERRRSRAAGGGATVSIFVTEGTGQRCGCCASTCSVSST